MSGQIDVLLADLVEELNSPRDLDIEDVMTRVVDFAAAALGVTDGSIFLSHRTSAGPLFESVVPTSPEVVKVDELQHEIGQGPSVDAVRSDDAIVCTDLTRDERWPSWSEAALSVGITGVISARLRAREQTIGALNLYSRAGTTMTVADVDTARQLAKHVAALLAATINQSTLNDALLSRSAIARAQGVLMERYGMTEDRAFELLKRVSQQNTVKIREIARRLADGESLASIDTSASPG
jgi:GAF domain-containing protein